MIPSYVKNEILTMREQMVPLDSNGLIYALSRDATVAKIIT